MGYLSPTLAVRNMKKTIEFYHEGLGFKLGMVFPSADHLDTAEYADLFKDGIVMMFIPARNLGIPAEAKLGIGVNLYMEIDGDIDKYYSELKRRGIQIAVDIKNEPFGIRDFTITDIDGYQITFNKRL